MRSPRRRRPSRPSSRAHRFATLAAVAGLLLGVVATAAPSGAAPAPAPTFKVTVSTQTQDTVGGKDPAVLVEVDNNDPGNHEDELFVTLELSPPGTTFNQDTEVRLTVGGLGTGTFSPSTVIFPKNLPSVVFDKITYDTVESGISLVATSGKGQKLVTGSSVATDPVAGVFDVGYDVVLQGPTSAPVTLGGDCTATPDVPLCAKVLLHKGMATRSALAVGACTTYYTNPADPDSAACSKTTGRIVSFMADVELTYTREDPATIILVCDKSYCRGGGISSYTLNTRLDWNALTFTDAPACQVKGQVPAGVPHCVDYVQSRRDNAGDLILYWLVAFDPRGAI